MFNNLHKLSLLFSNKTILSDNVNIFQPKKKLIKGIFDLRITREKIYTLGV